MRLRFGLFEQFNTPNIWHIEIKEIEKSGRTHRDIM